MAPTISLAVCTRNGGQHLLRALDSVARQDWAGTWEALVVDNGSDDGSFEAAQRRVESFPAPMRVVREELRGLSYARNRALEQAEGEVVIFIDDDAVCRPGFIAAHAEAYEDPDTVAAGGRILPVFPPSAPDWLVKYDAQRIGGPTSRYDYGDTGCVISPGGQGLQFPFGANMSVRREAARALGGFRVDLGWGASMIPGEETELFARLARQGGVLRYVPDAAADHHIAASRISIDYYVRWFQGHGRSTILIDPPISFASLLSLTLSEIRNVIKFYVRMKLAKSESSSLYFNTRKNKAIGRLKALLGAASARLRRQRAAQSAPEGPVAPPVGADGS